MGEANRATFHTLDTEARAVVAGHLIKLALDIVGGAPVGEVTIEANRDVFDVYEFGSADPVATLPSLVSYSVWLQ